VWVALPSGSKTAPEVGVEVVGLDPDVRAGQDDVVREGPVAVDPDALGVDAQVAPAGAAVAAPAADDVTLAGDELTRGSTSVTSEPTSATSPLSSWPTIIGGRTVSAAHWSQSCRWRSVPHSPARRTRIFTSRGPGVGSGTSISVQSGASSGLHQGAHPVTLWCPHHRAMRRRNWFATVRVFFADGGLRSAGPCPLITT
jgi:hypothetical protein